MKPSASLAGWGIGFHGKRALRPLVWTLLLGPAVFIVGWPWMWHDTMPRIQEYLNFHLNHEYYNIEFLGKKLR